jgi:hypothetical protein
MKILSPGMNFIYNLFVIFFCGKGGIDASGFKKYIVEYVN